VFPKWASISHDMALGRFGYTEIADITHVCSALSQL